MASSVPAYVNHQMLVWARETSGFDREAVAKRLRTTIARVSEWEDGTSLPSMPQARKLAALYRRPLSLFYFDVPPLDPPRPTDFRLVGESRDAFPSALRFAIRDAHDRRAAALRLLNLLGKKPVAIKLRATIDEDSDVVGSRLRDWVRLKDDEQTTADSVASFYSLLRSKFESRGVMTFQMSRVDENIASGFSIAAEVLPTITINNKILESRRTFTLFHELAHIALRQGGVCDLSYLEFQLRQSRNVETFCNRAAGCALVPRASLLRHPIVAAHRGSEIWTNDDLHIMAAHFSVSMSAILIRLKEIGKTNEQFVRKRLSEFRKTDANENDQGGFSWPHDKVAALNGQFFARLVLDSLYSEQISLRDVSDLLGLNLSHLDQLADKVYREAS